MKYIRYVGMEELVIAVSFVFLASAPLFGMLAVMALYANP